jgi:uncharacterized protein (TIRG00374 family)
LQISRAIRIGGTILCIAFILWLIDLDQLAETLIDPNWLFVSLCVALTPLLILMSVWRWYILLRARSVVFPFGSLLRIYLIGCFFNQFAPSTIGGDAFRIYGTRKHALPTHLAAAAVIVDRLTGLYMVLLWVIMSLLVVAARTGESDWLVVAGGLTLIFVISIYLLVGSLVERLYQIESQGIVGKVIATLASWHTSIRQYGNHPGALVTAILFSLIFLFLSGLNYWFAALSFQSNIDIERVFLIFPSILLLGSLPISLGGWGLNELSTAAVFDVAGFDAVLGLSAALLIRLKNLGIALIGGLLLLLSRDSASTEVCSSANKVDSSSRNLK